MEMPHPMHDFISPLFASEHNELHGQWDPQARRLWENITQGMSDTFPAITEENVPLLRSMSAHDPAARSPGQQAIVDRCTTTVMSFDGTKYGSLDNSGIEIRVHVPNSSSNREHNKAVVYFHGGAFIMYSAADMDVKACGIASDCDAVAFNVDYRNAPEARAPGGILDCYAALQYVVNELAHQFKVDASKVCIHGESSGGYLTAGVAMELAKRNEAHLVKLAVLDIPALSDHWIKPAKPGAWHWSMSEVEAWHGTHGHIETLKMLATDWQKQFAASDPYIFPGAMSDELIGRLPNHAVITNEFDFLRHDAELFADRLRKRGKLLDFHIRPGISHYSPADNQVLCRLLA